MQFSTILIQAITYFFFFLKILLFIRIILSWLPFDAKKTFLNIVYILIDPILNPIRTMIQKSPLGGRGMILDFSPIIAYIIFELLERLLISIVAYL